MSSSLAEAATCGDWYAVKVILTGIDDFDVNGKTELSLPIGSTALGSAAFQNNLAGALLLLNNGADINLTNKNGDTPLSLAVYKGSTDVALLLIERGADVSILNKSGESVLASAAYRNNDAVLKVLLNLCSPEIIYGAAIESTQGMYRVFNTLQFGSPWNEDWFNTPLLLPNETGFHSSDEPVEAKGYHGLREHYQERYTRPWMSRLLSNSLSKLDPGGTWIMYHEFASPLPYFTDMRILRAFILVSERLSKPELFDNEVVLSAVEGAWVTFGRQFHLTLLSLYLLLLSAVTISNFRFHSWILSEDYKFVVAAIALQALTLFLDAFFTCLEMRQCYSVFRENKLILYASDTQNALDWSAYILLFAGTSYRVYLGEETLESASIMAVATILVWLKLLYFLRPFRSTGPLVRMIFFIFYSVKELMGILVLVLFSFSQSLYLLSYHDDTLDFSDPMGSIIHSFLYMMGGSQLGQMTQSSNPDLAQFLLCILIFLTSILLLNLLIALMNNSYGTIQSKEVAEWNRERAKIMTEQWLPGSSATKKYHYVLMRKEDHDQMLLKLTSPMTAKMTKMEEAIEALKKSQGESQEMLSKIMEHLGITAEPE